MEFRKRDEKFKKKAIVLDLIKQLSRKYSQGDLMTDIFIKKIVFDFTAKINTINFKDI